MKKEIKLERHGLFGSRETLTEAIDYFNFIIHSMPKEDRFPMITGLYVLRNTLAEKYRVFEREAIND